VPELRVARGRTDRRSDIKQRARKLNSAPQNESRVQDADLVAAIGELADIVRCVVADDFGPHTRRHLILRTDALINDLIAIAEGRTYG
jgi:hypothetical protein